MYLVDQVEGADGGAADWRVEQPVGGPRTEFGTDPWHLRAPRLQHIMFPSGMRIRNFFPRIRIRLR